MDQDQREAEKRLSSLNSSLTQSQSRFECDK